jgi:DNA-damage-inducible protein J
MAHIQLRIDEKTKKEAIDLFDTLGMDLSGAITVFLRQAILTQSIPFPLRTANGFTPEQEQQILRETRASLMYGKRYSSAAELLRDTLGDQWKNSPTRSSRRRNSKKTSEDLKSRGSMRSKR